MSAVSNPFNAKKSTPLLAIDICKIVDSMRHASAMINYAAHIDSGDVQDDLINAAWVLACSLRNITWTDFKDYWQSDEDIYTVFTR